MKTIILGQKIENVYTVNLNFETIEDENGKVKTIYTAKPTLKKTSTIKEWVKICSYTGEPRYNSTTSLFGYSLTQPQLNISEDETVQIKEQIFRADLNEMHLRTNKIVKEIDMFKEEALATLSEQIRAFNAMMITSNDKLQSYCDVHKLSYEDTDAIELFNIVFPNQCYEIKDGVIAPKNVNMYVSSACLTAEQGNWGTIATNNYNSVNCAIGNIVKAEK